MRNLFVVEGIDGVGKTTIIDRLKELNKNPNLLFDAEPSRAVLELFPSLNPIQRFLAVMSDRMYRLKHNSLPQYEGKDFVFDRYEPSTYVYNVCLGGVPFSEFLDWRVNVGTVIPNYYFYVEAPNHVIQERIHERGNEKVINASEDHLNLLRYTYESFFTEFCSNGSLIRLDGTKDPVDNASIILRKIWETIDEQDYDKYQGLEI